MKKKALIQCITIALSTALSAGYAEMPGQQLLAPLTNLFNVKTSSASADNAPAATTATPPPEVSTPAAPDGAMQTPSAPANTAESLRNQANERWQAGEKEQALAIVTDAIAQFPDDADNYFQRSAFLSDLKRYDAALADARRATELAPNSGRAWGNLGWYLILNGDFAAAQTASGKAQALTPERFEWTLNLGHAYLLQGDRETAHQWYEKTIPLISDEEALKSGPLADFDFFIERGWQVEASKAERAWFESTAQQSFAKKLDHAIEAIKVRLGWNELVDVAKEWWNTFEDQNKDNRKTVLTLYQEIEKRNATLTSFFFAYVDSNAKTIPQILEYMDKQKSEKEQYRLADEQWQKGQELAKSNLYLEAAEAYQHAVEAEKASGKPRINDLAAELGSAASMYIKAGRYNEAEPLYLEVLNIREKALGPDHPDVAKSLNNLAILYRTQGQYAKAEPLYQRSLAIREKALGLDHPDVATSLNNLALLYQDQGQYAQAEPLYKRSLAILEKALGHEHPDTATSLNNLALLYDSQGQYGKAEPLYQRALAIREKALGPEHPSTATSLNNLAALYQAQGQYGKAEPLYQRALVIYEKALGPEHPELATNLNNLAFLYNNQGQYAQAEPLYQRALAIREKNLGPDHPDTATSLHSLATLYQAQGQYGKAEPLYQRALAIYEKALGPEHPSTATILNNLALLYNYQGQYGKAEPLYQRALAIREKALGHEHPSTAASLNNLAALYQDQGQYAQAEPLYQRALVIYEKAMGPEHPDTATSLNNLAGLYQDQGQYGKAEPLYQRALAIKENALGPEHPSTATSLNTLALLYNNQGQYGKAEPLYQRALAIKEKALGPEHPDTATSLNNLAFLYDNQGQYGKAEPLYQRALAIYEKALGPEHPYTATSLNNLAALYQDQGQYAQAEPLYKRALAITEKALGPEHPSTATNLNNLAGLYQAQGQYAPAEPFFKRALAIHEKALGPEHPDTATSLNNLAGLYDNQGQYGKAEPLFQHALAIREKALGPEHPDTATSLNNLAWLYYSQGQYAQSLEYIRKASRIYRERIFANSRNASTGAASERTGFKNTFNTHISIAASRLAEAPELRDPLTAETFEISQLFHDGAVGDALTQMAARFASGNDQLADLAKDKEDTQRAWQKADADIVTAASKSPAERNPTVEAELRSREKDLKEKLRALNEQLAREYPEYAELTIPRPASVEQTQKLLKPGEALAAFVLGDKKSFVWIVQPDSVTFRQIDRTQKEIDEQVKKLRAKLSPDSNPNLEAFPVAEAHALYQDLLGPESAQLEKVKTLFVTADGALESLPFAVLVTEPPGDAPNDYQKVAWLSRKWATATLPTTSSLRALRTLASKGKAPSEPFIGFGNPNFSGKSSEKNRNLATVALTRSVIADPQVLSMALMHLPETADELRAIAQTLNADADALILGKEANVPKVQATALAKYRVVDFATHALVAGDLETLRLSNAEPAIALSVPEIATAENDGLLRASQVAQLKLNADWVVLSACNTAAPDGTPGAVGLSGLAKAFFYAGARAMLVSHWSVVSDPAVTLTTMMFKEWQTHPELGRAEALRRAEMALLDNPRTPADTHPQSWAPFVVAGEGGAGR